MKTKQSGQPHTRRQRWIRRRAVDLHLRGAVRLAVNTFFRFTHRSKDAKALWSQRERVWIGNRTFLEWALSEAEIDIPWIVAKSADAPESKNEFRRAVREELLACWADQMAELPSKSTPRWPPLPS